MNEHTSNANGNGAEVARLTERSYAQQGEIKTLRDKVDALEAVVHERSGVRNWLPSAAIIAAGTFAIFIFGLKPLEDKIADNGKSMVNVRDDAEKQREVIWRLSREAHAEMKQKQKDLNKQRDDRIKNLEDLHFRVGNLDAN